MPSTIAEIDRLFAAGAESVTLTRDDWCAIQELSKGYFANGLEVGRAQREMERVKRISRRRCGAPQDRRGADAARVGRRMARRAAHLARSPAGGLSTVAGSA